MANDLTIDPISLDTAHATNVVLQGDTYVYGIKFSGGTTAGHVAELTYKSGGGVFWRGSCSGNGSDAGLEVLRKKTQGDIVCSTLTSGKLLIYRGPER